MENEDELFDGDIKQEPERQYVVIIPESLEKRYQLRELNVTLKKFDKKWRLKARMFGNYSPCKKCADIARECQNLKIHLPRCEGNTNQTKYKNIYECAFCEL